MHGEEFGQLLYDEPLETVLLGLLGDRYWGKWGATAPAVDSILRAWVPGFFFFLVPD
jgi:hypothetical protein